MKKLTFDRNLIGFSLIISTLFVAMLVSLLSGLDKIQGYNEIAVESLEQAA